MKIRPLAAELFHADGQTDVKKLTVNFYNLGIATKSCALFELYVFVSFLYISE